MSARLESFLARLYVDAGTREAYVADPEGEAKRAGLTASEQASMRRLDSNDLNLAASGYARKRARRPVEQAPSPWPFGTLRRRRRR